jgi:predicted Zn-dependent protease
MVYELFTLKLGREQETLAGLTGLLLLQRAKVNPSGMSRFFERLSEKDEGWMEWISSHSMSPARAERLKKELASLPRQETIPFSVEWAGSIG